MQNNLYRRKPYRLSFFLLLWICAASLAATPQFKVDPLHVFLKRLEERHHITFVYDASEINRAIPIESDVENTTLQAALDLLLAKGITYKMVGDKVVLQRSKPTVADFVVQGDVRVMTGDK